MSDLKKTKTKRTCVNCHNLVSKKQMLKTDLSQWVCVKCPVVEHGMNKEVRWNLANKNAGPYFDQDDY